MIIPFNTPADADNSIEKVEWVMIELNGELLRPLDESGRTATVVSPGADGDVDNNGKGKRRRVELGGVKFDSDGSPTLIIGNHQLKGTATKLKEPFAVLRKRKKSIQTTNDGDATPSKKKLKLHSGVELEVVGIVKKKLMFDQYPKSIMRN